MSHLGGHGGNTWVDEGAVTFLAKKFEIKNMLDIGCGPGGMKKIALDNNIHWVGIDGDISVEQDGVIIHDFTKNSIEEIGYFDLGWSVEFLEHVEEKYMPNYMSAFRKCKHVMCTAAPIGWGGHHHVNEQSQEYWVEKFKNYGFTYDPEVSNLVKENSTMRKKHGKSFIERTGMYFRRDV
tara:strand:+ start:214 stop:753 length:540 start_codon:yes stop_codon:yes gene_type:complete